MKWLANAKKGEVLILRICWKPQNSIYRNLISHAFRVGQFSIGVEVLWNRIRPCISGSMHAQGHCIRLHALFRRHCGRVRNHSTSVDHPAVHVTRQRRLLQCSAKPASNWFYAASPHLPTPITSAAVVHVNFVDTLRGAHSRTGNRPDMALSRSHLHQGSETRQPLPAPFFRNARRMRLDLDQVRFQGCLSARTRAAKGDFNNRSMKNARKSELFCHWRITSAYDTGDESFSIANLMTRPLDNCWEREANIFSLPPNAAALHRGNRVHSSRFFCNLAWMRVEGTVLL